MEGENEQQLSDEATGGDIESGTTTSEGIFQFKGKKKVSDVWNYFVKKKEEKKAQCKLCGKQLAYHGGTSNLRDHLTNIHPVKYQPQGCSSMSKSKEGPMDRMFKTKCCSNTRSKEITDKIVNMIVMDTRPIRMVECEGFRELIHCLEPGFVMPSRQSIKLIVFRKHQEGKSKLTNLLSSVNALSLTTDIWTSEANDAYITVTVYCLVGNEIIRFRYKRVSWSSYWHSRKSKLTNLLSSVNTLSLTTDIWTSEANDAYITVTVYCLVGNEIIRFRYKRVSWSSYWHSHI